MPEVREQAEHAAAFRLQRGEIREWRVLFRLGLCFRQLWVYAAFLRVPLASR